MQLSQNENIIMQLLWTENRPLSRAEILKGTPGRNWNPASIHLILNSMISKGAIKITDEEKKYGRTYEVCFTQAEYLRNELHNLCPDQTDSEILITVVDSLIDGGHISSKNIDALQECLTSASSKKKIKKK